MSAVEEAVVEEAVAGVVATTEAAEVTVEVVIVAEMKGIVDMLLVVHSRFVEFGMVDT